MLKKWQATHGWWVLVVIWAATAIWLGLLTQWSWPAWALMAAGTLCVLLTASSLQRDARLQQQIEAVLGEARLGKLERRVILVPHGHRLTGISRGINDTLDQIEAVLRESLTVVSRMTRMGSSTYTRPPQTDGLHGMFPVILTRISSVQQRVNQTIFTLGDVMNAMAGGEFKRQLNADTEVGALRQILENAQQAIDSLDGILSEVTSVLARMAQGDLTPRVVSEGQGGLAQLRTDINQALYSLSESMHALGVGAKQVAYASSEANQAVAQISDGAQSQGMAIQQVAAAVRQAANAIADISRNTEAASQTSRQSVQSVRLSIQRMEEMVQVVTNIASNSEKINKITDVIEKIAHKTNLLALNAAIEAARAGEHGKGFAVVADEVGKLALSSAESSKEIAGLVGQAVSETHLAVKAVHQVRDEMGKIDEGAMQADTMLQRIASAVEQQNAAIEEITANLDNVNRIAQNSASAAVEITETIGELAKIAQATRSEVDKFTC